MYRKKTILHCHTKELLVIKHRKSEKPEMSIHSTDVNWTKADVKIRLAPEIMTILWQRKKKIDNTVGSYVARSHRDENKTK